VLHFDGSVPVEYWRSFWAFLSGGVDSSAIVALMGRHTAEQVKTFSLGFDIGGAYDELDDARKVAQHLGTDHHELRVGADELVKAVRTLVYHYDEQQIVVGALVTTA
jgi:asparagine synthase (glutamine-hydrolysing)